MQQTKATLFLSYDGLTDPLGQSQILPYLMGIAQGGYQVHIVSFEKKDRLEALSGHIMDTCKEKGIHWHPLEYHKSPPVLSTLYDLYRMRRISESLHREIGFSLIHARSYPPALVALQIKKKFGIPYIFDIRGFWPEERVEGGIWNLKNPFFRMIYHYFKRREVALYKKASAIVVLTHKAKDILEERQELSPLPVLTVIPCCVDMVHFDPDKISEDKVLAIRKSLQLAATDYVLCYVGSIGTWYMLDEMMQFFRALKEKEPKAKFLFVTRDRKEHIMEIATSHGVGEEDIRIIAATYAEVPGYIAAAQASIFFIRPSFSKQASSPTKQGELLAMGKPIVTNVGVGDSDEILNKTGGGVLVHEFSDIEYLTAVKDLLLLVFSPEEVRQRTVNIYSLEEGVKKYSEIYDFILS